MKNRSERSLCGAFKCLSVQTAVRLLAAVRLYSVLLKKNNGVEKQLLSGDITEEMVTESYNKSMSVTNKTVIELRTVIG